MAPERGGERVFVPVADRRGDPGERRVGPGKFIFGALHAHRSHVAARRLPGDFAEARREGGTGHPGEVRHGGHRPRAGRIGMDMLKDAPQPGLRQRAVPPRGPGPGPRPPGPQGEDQVEVEQPVEQGLLPGGIPADLAGQQVDGRGVGRIGQMAMAGNPTMGSSLNEAMVSRVM